MKRTLLAAILATAAIAFSCTMEEPAQDNSVVKNPTVTIADFVYDGAYTKTTADFENNVASFAFEASDVLRAYPLPDGDGLRFTVKTPKGTACVFEGEGFGLEAGTSYAAYYPGDSETVPAVNEVPVDFSAQSQPAASEWNLSDVDFLFATGIQPANGACEFSMKHLGALLIMNVTFEKAGVFKSLELCSNAEFPVTGTVDLTAENVALTATATANKIALALGGENGMEVAAGDVVTFYMMVPPVDMSNATLTLNLLDANDKVVLTKQGPGINFQAGNAVAFGATPAAPVVNLSAKGTANTYIVSEAGDYCFDATVAGNGAAGIVDLFNQPAAKAYPASKTYALPAGGGVRVLLNQNNCVSNVSFNNGKIYFTASGAKGNAKIQLRDTNDDGAWIWLIWCTDAPAAVTLTDASSWSYHYKVLDRNIGALTAGVDEDNPENMWGLYYQFANPHPYTYSQYWQCDKGGYGMKDAIALNDKVFTGPDYYWWNPYSDSGSQNKIHGYISGGGSANDGSLKRGPAATKTIYDPCPVGYKVMPIDFVFSASDGGGNVWGFYKNGTDGTLFFPYNGACCDSGWGEAPGPYDPVKDEARFCSLWTTGHGGTNMGYYFQIYAKGENRAGGGTNPTKVVGYGMGIRCVADVE